MDINRGCAQVPLDSTSCKEYYFYNDRSKALLANIVDSYLECMRKLFDMTKGYRQGQIRRFLIIF